MLHVARENWFKSIPEGAGPPKMETGEVAVEFSIKKDGSVSAMKWVHRSGSASLDRAAWVSINASKPFPPLPADFRGKNLALRFHFFYNLPKKG